MNVVGIYYSHAEPPGNIGPECRKAIAKAADAAKMPVVYVVSWAQREDISKQAAATAYSMAVDGRRSGHMDISDRIKEGCSLAMESFQGTHVLLFEHDVLYPADYCRNAVAALKQRLKFGRGESYMYQGNVWRLTRDGFGRVRMPETLTSQLLAPVGALRDTMANRIEFMGNGGRIVWGEPGRDWENCPDVPLPIVHWSNATPTVDLRYGGNLTGDRRIAGCREEVEYLPTASKIWQIMGIEREGGR